MTMKEGLFLEPLKISFNILKAAKMNRQPLWLELHTFKFTIKS
jgi:hypothetical protein